MHRLLSRKPASGPSSRTSPSADVTTAVDQYTARGLIGTDTVTITSRVDGDAETSSYTTDRTYDGVADRLATTTYPDSSGADYQLSYQYGPYGAPYGMSGSDGRDIVVDMHDDIRGRLLEASYGNRVRDLQVFADDADNGYLRYTQTAGPAWSGQSCEVATNDSLQALVYSARDANGSITRVDDLLLPSDHPRSNYQDVTYNRFGRITGVTYQTGAGGVAVDEDTFSYEDSLGNFATKNGAAYQYDPLHPHRPQLVDGVTITHDADGNRTAKGSRTYTYDAFGRLAEVEDSGAVVSTHGYLGTDRVFRAVADGMDIERTHYHGGQFEIVDGEILRHYYLGGRRLASDRIVAPAGMAVAASPPGIASDASASALARTAGSRSSALRATPPTVGPELLVVVALLWLGAGVGICTRPRGRRVATATAWLYAMAVIPIPYFEFAAPLFGATTANAQPTPGDIVYYHVDHLGSPQVVTDGSGLVVETVRYRVFGEVRGRFDANGQSISESATELTFTGQIPDTESGLIYFGARFYDPELGLFASPDPVDQYASPYAYVGYRPLDMVDPDGRSGILAIAIIAAVAATTAFVATLIQTGDVGVALKAGASTGLTTFVGGAASAL